MKINTLAEVKEQSTYFEEDYRIWIESFNPYLRTSPEIKTVTPAIAYKYQGDFYGLLDTLSVPKQYHYILMRYNGFLHSGDYDGLNTEIKLPDLKMIDKLRQLYNTASSHF